MTHSRRRKKLCALNLHAEAMAPAASACYASSADVYRASIAALERDNFTKKAFGRVDKVIDKHPRSGVYAKTVYTTRSCGSGGVSPPAWSRGSSAM